MSDRFDALVDALQSTGAPVLAFSELDSTNSEALRLIDQRAVHGSVVVAERQTAGRGRMGRAWYSPAGSLLMSVILRPDWAATRAPRVTLQAAVSVARALEAIVGRAPGLKWPNDVRFDGRKVCGILTELRTEGSRVGGIVVGMGINVAPLPNHTPPQVAVLATSLTDAAGAPVDRARAGAAVLSQLMDGYREMLKTGTFDRSAWRAYADMLGRKVTISAPGMAPVDAVAKDITEDGLLLVERDGRVEEVLAGDVTLKG